MTRRLKLVLVALALLAPPAEAEPGGVWTPTLRATQGFDHLSAFPNGVFYAQYLDSYVRSVDFGMTWTRMEPPYGGNHLGSPGIRFATPTVGYALGGNSSDALGLAEEVKTCGRPSPFYKTTNAGTTWSPICLPVPPPGRVRREFGPEPSPMSVTPDGRTVMLVGADHDAVHLPDEDERECDVPAVYTSHNGGASWIRATLPFPYQASWQSRVYDDRTALVVAYKWEENALCGNGGEAHENAVFVTDDGGRTFHKVLDCGRAVCTAARFVTRSRIVVGRSDGSTAISDDAGRTWRKGQSLTNAHYDRLVATGQVDARYFWVQGFSFADARNGFASTRGGGTWRTTNGGISWTQEMSHECQFFPWGIGEIAAGGPDRALTGGPEWISARTPVEEAPGGCAGPEPQFSAPAGPVLVTAAGAIRQDGSMTRS